jgi:HK97 family phage prohead protease
MKRKAPAVGKLLRAVFTPELRSIDEKNRTIEFVASTEAVDRYGDIIRVGGWKLDNYIKNPVFLLAHNTKEPPIGKTVSVTIETNPPALVQKVQFADAETYPRADTIFRLYKGGFMRAVSVGFMPLEAPEPIKDGKGFEFTSQELLELSAVSVPANPEAVARDFCDLPGAVKDGAISGEEAESLGRCLGVEYEQEDSGESEENAEEPNEDTAVPVASEETEMPKEKHPGAAPADGDRTSGVSDVLKRITATRDEISGIANSLAHKRDLADAAAKLEGMDRSLAGLSAKMADIASAAVTRAEIGELVNRIDQVRTRVENFGTSGAKDALVAEAITRIEELRARVDRLAEGSLKKTALSDLSAKVDATQAVVDGMASGVAKRVEVADVTAGLADLRSRFEILTEAVADRAGLSHVSIGVDELRARMDNLVESCAKEQELTQLGVRIEQAAARDDVAAGQHTVLVDTAKAIHLAIDEIRTPVQAQTALLTEILSLLRRPGFPEEERAVCPYKADPIAPKGTKWDAAAEMATAHDPAGWKRMCTVIVGDPKNKTSYKLPHHRGPNGKWSVVPNGVRAALGRFEQTQMSSSDRPGARAHLVKHQKAIAAQHGADFDESAFEAKLAALGEAYRSAESAGLSDVMNSVEREIDAHVATLEFTEAPKPEESAIPDPVLAELGL